MAHPIASDVLAWLYSLPAGIGVPLRHVIHRGVRVLPAQAHLLAKYFFGGHDGGTQSFFPAIVFFCPNMACKEGRTLPLLSDALMDHYSTVINAETLAFVTIPLMASLMVLGVLYTEDFPLPLGVALFM